ncbi:hypothetical protein A7P53_00390 [Acinetobacter defluvii]|nr:hypothetical protein [Acinetobacter defluvii]
MSLFTTSEEESKAYIQVSELKYLYAKIQEYQKEIRKLTKANEELKSELDLLRLNVQLADQLDLK